MADDAPKLPLYEVPYLRLFPWLRLFHAPGAAADPKRLMLAVLGLFVMDLGWVVLDRAFPDSGAKGFTGSSVTNPSLLGPWEPVAQWDVAPGVVLGRLAEPPWALTQPFRKLFSPTADAATTLHALLAGAWTMLVWGLIGGAIARVAVIDVTRGERVGLAEALKFAARKAQPLLVTPLLPLVGLGFVAGLIGVFGLLYRIPGSFAPTAAGVLAFLPLLGGLVLALILLGLATGWPLMYVSVAAEAEDGFDAMSRAYAYTRQRAWNCAAYVAIAALAGAVGLLFVDLFAQLVVALTQRALTLGGPAATVAAYYAAGKAVVPPSAAAAHGFWLSVVGLLVHAWVYSYFWTVASVVYLLLRRDVDGTPLGAVAHDAPPSLLAEAAARAEEKGSGTFLSKKGS
jgi:hypothetical protein